MPDDIASPDDSRPGSPKPDRPGAGFLVLCALNVLSLLGFASHAHASMIAFAQYALHAVLLVHLIAMYVLGRRVGIHHDAFGATTYSAAVTYFVIACVNVVDDLQRHSSPVIDAVFAALVLAFLISGAGRSGRNAARRLLGEKSRALLAKLTVAQPQPVRLTK